MLELSVSQDVKTSFLLHVGMARTLTRQKQLPMARDECIQQSNPCLMQKEQSGTVAGKIQATGRALQAQKLAKACNAETRNRKRANKRRRNDVDEEKEAFGPGNPKSGLGNLES
jgi:hypothetical protein